MKLLFLIGLIVTTAWTTVPGQNTQIVSIENVNVIPMTSNVVLYNQRVLVSGGKILRIEPASEALQSEVNQTIDGAGKFLIPGLSEMHYHFRSNDIESDFKLLTANGITTVRNMAEPDRQNHIEIRNKLEAGELIGPNYYTAGPYLRSGDLQTENKVTDVVREHRESEYDFLKIADNLPRKIYLKLLEDGQKFNVPIVGHAQRNLPLEYSLRMRSIEHVEEFLYLNDGDPANSFFKQSGTELNKLARQIKSSGIYVGTTLTVFDFIINCLDDEKFTGLQRDNLVKYLAPEQRAGFLSEQNDYRKLRNRIFEGMPAKDYFGAQFSWMKSFTSCLAENEVPLLTGSDTYGMVIVGFSLHREFELLQESGMEPYSILLASTVTPARYLNAYASEGTIAEGKNANLVLLDRNPLDDIKNTTAIAGVMLKGNWFSRQDLDSMLYEVEMAFK